jgi:GNAT superfamily N-acetyltransferase
MSERNDRVFSYNPYTTGHPAFVLVYENAKKKDPVGWAFILGDGEEGCLLADIWVDPKVRRQGYGMDLLRTLQSRYRRVWTGLSTPEGRAMCTKAGFMIKRGMFKRDVPRLEWVAPWEVEKPSAE